MLNLESQVLMKVELVKLVIVWLRKFNATSELASFNFGERFLNPYLTIILNTKNWPTLGEYLVWRVRITSFNSN